jgi:uncharacterized protein YdeI (YjbR/CyaY-like superfamily)
MEARYFTSGEEFRGWLAENHDKSDELLVGFYKKGSGRPSLTYPEALDEALCFGWIDGVRRRVDGERYTIRFTPRRKGSNWSQVNIKRVEELIGAGRMAPPGVAAFEQRDQSGTAEYSYEQRERGLAPELEARFRADEVAWDFFAKQPPGYRKTASWFVMSAKREETRLKRLARLMEDSANGRRLAEVTLEPKK